MRRFTVMGFTEAELGFVVAALFAAVAVATLNDRDVSASDGQKVRQILEETRAELERTKAELGKTRRELEQALIKLKKFQDEQEKRSTKMPQCWEKGRQRAPIGEVVVLGENSYELEGEVANIDRILERFSSSVSDGESLGCRYVLKAWPSADVNAVSHSKAVALLRRHFDVDDRSK